MKHDANRCGVSKKMFIAMLALVLALGCAVGGTIAWLTAETDPVVNTFTYGDINIELYEHEYDAANNALTMKTTKTGVNNYKIVPGKNLPKDPTVKVLADSEACWLFVKVEATGDFADSVTYSVDTTAGNWKELASAGSGNTKVYYREVNASTQAQEFQVLKGDKNYPNGVVTVSEGLTKTEINNITANNAKPTLTFTAYAVQRDGVDNVTTAWAKVSTAVTP